MKRYLRLIMNIIYSIFDTLLNGTEPGNKYINGYYIHGNYQMGIPFDKKK